MKTIVEIPGSRNIGDTRDTRGTRARYEHKISKEKKNEY